MHNHEEESFVFLRFADGDISEALLILEELASAKTEFLRVCLLKQAAVSYIRPFKLCRGSFGKHKLAAKHYVPPGTRELHEEVVGFRDEAFAHTDLRVRAPVLHCWTKVSPIPIFPIVFKNPTYPVLLKRIDDLLTCLSLYSLRSEKN